MSFIRSSEVISLDYFSKRLSGRAPMHEEDYYNFEITTKMNIRLYGNEASIIRTELFHVIFVRSVVR